MAIKNTTYKRFGFFTALSMVIGSVVGIGIFFKNGGVFATTEGNSISVLIAWILGGIISLFAALSFAEVFRMIEEQLKGDWLVLLKDMLEQNSVDL